MKFSEYKNLTEEEKQFWQFQQLSCIGELKEDFGRLNKRMNYVYAWATGVAAAFSFVFMLVKSRFFD